MTLIFPSVGAVPTTKSLRFAIFGKFSKKFSTKNSKILQIVTVFWKDYRNDLVALYAKLFLF